MTQEEKFFTGFNAKLTQRSRELRHNMTKQEQKLWYGFLRRYPVKFYRQRSIDCFIADFYCSRAHLVVEVDGEQHYTDDGREYDKKRTEVIEKYGLQVIRFSNSAIDTQFEHVCKVIDKTIEERLSNQ